jgi:hypothetical protein
MSQELDIVRLARWLEKCEGITKFGKEPTSEAWELAHALVDISESAKRLHAELIPSLLLSRDEGHILAQLGEIGEELRHVLYHIENSRYFAYLR